MESPAVARGRVRIDRRRSGHARVRATRDPVTGQLLELVVAVLALLDVACELGFLVRIELLTQETVELLCVWTGNSISSMHVQEVAGEIRCADV